jgi:hypothetical protein
MSMESTGVSGKLISPAGSSSQDQCLLKLAEAELIAGQHSRCRPTAIRKGTLSSFREVLCSEDTDRTKSGILKSCDE